VGELSLNPHEVGQTRAIDVFVEDAHRNQAVVGCSFWRRRIIHHSRRFVSVACPATLTAAQSGYIKTGIKYIKGEAMKTLLDIDAAMMEELLETAGTRVKKEAVVTAIKSFIEAKKREKLADLVGNYEFGYSAEDLQRMREDGPHRH
jgi:Arc/MetJ family transcription regulator